MPKDVLNYEESGRGSPLVLVHGFPFDHTIWQAQLDSLSNKARVIAPDLPGFGGSDALGGAEPTIDQYADRLSEWVFRIGLGRVTLVGHSMGGYVALAFARRYPESLAGLGLVCTRAAPDTPEQREGRYALVAQVWDRGAQAVVDLMLPRLISPETREKRPDTEARLRELMLKQQPAGLVNALEAMAARPDAAPYLEKINVPTLVVTGQDDAIIPAAEADLMASLIPGARRETISGAAHMPMMERPEKLNDMLADLVRGALTEPGVPAPPSRQEDADTRTRPES